MSEFGGNMLRKRMGWHRVCFYCGRGSRFLHPIHRSLRLVLRSEAESLGEVNSAMGIFEAQRLLKEEERK